MYGLFRPSPLQEWWVFAKLAGEIRVNFFYYSIDYPRSWGRANQWVCEFSEGGTKILYTTKLVPSKDLGSNVHLNTNCWKYYIESITIHWNDQKYLSWHYSQTNICLHMIYFFYHSTYTSKHAHVFLKCVVNEHTSMNLVSFDKHSNTH